MNREALDLATSKVREAANPGAMAASLICALFKLYAEQTSQDNAATLAWRLCRLHSRLGARLFVKRGKVSPEIARVFRSDLARKHAHVPPMPIPARRPTLSLPKEAA